ncbi:MAG TPA: hypothetical protein VFV22_01010 [Candidatus Paceibacterota bacterium]|nr:hypothetical protein [Candidatus Paceibacterota bacterium]
MQNLFIYIIDTIFPPSEHLKRVRQLNQPHVTNLYAPHTFEDITALSSFHNPDIHALIHEAKFHANTHAHVLLSALLMHHLKEHPLTYDYIIPIPLSPARYRARGYNQVYEILHHTSIPQKNHMLSTMKRVRDTRPQTELARNERISNMRKAFIIKQPQQIVGKHIVLLDDVTTTGATLHAAKAALLLHHPASVTCIALAH